jgi:hypothetical protein
MNVKDGCAGKKTRQDWKEECAGRKDWEEECEGMM